MYHSKNDNKNHCTRLRDIQISYTDSGEGEVPLVFLHGFPFNKSSWDPQTEHFKKTGRVIAIDLRGFGGSDKGEEPFSMDLFANDLIAFLDTLGIKKATLCGLSMGGYIALNAVTRFPDRFAALILCDTQCIADTDEAKNKRIQSIQQIQEGGMKEFTDGFLAKLFAAETGNGIREMVKNMMNDTDAKTITSTLMALAERRESCSSLVKITVPTLILCGSDDVITPPERSAFMHQNISQSQIQIISGAGHLSNLEQPGVFNTLLSEFLNER